MRVYIWDLPLRLFHWILVLLVIASVYTGLDGGMDAMDLHQWSGYGVCSALLFRLIWGLLGSNTSRFSHWRWQQLRSELRQWHNSAATVGHSAAGSYASALLLLLVLAQAISGLFASDDIFYEGPLVYLLSNDQVNMATGIHHWAFKALLLMIGLHLLAILLYKLFKNRNLALPMVVGFSQDENIQGADYGGHHSPVWLAVFIALVAIAAIYYALF